ncbi:subtilisin-like protein [Parathielavia appendiculata]|uniref:Subtilisin-like protein n=1 Tax=Parathielavia appendiculata TaxID=2587402 RepID=A0AAN6TVA1_9PEZI|nr:subtilisin-like protein [Parathielavia appendiculata]
MRPNIVVCGFAALVVFPSISALPLIQNEGVLCTRPPLMLPQERSMRDTVDGNSKKGNKRGYVAEIPASELVQLSWASRLSISRNTIVKTAAIAADPNLAKRTMVTQRNASWGLARISHRRRGYTGYYYSDTAGNDVRVYVIDTGIRLSHVDFGDRAVWGTYGVSKKAVVVAVKVLDHSGTGTMLGQPRGLDWAVADAERRGTAVINVSLTGFCKRSVNEGVKAATDAGMTVVNWTPAAIMSGASTAMPHVAGLAAYFIAGDGLSGSAAVTERILSAATQGVGDRKESADQTAPPQSSPEPEECFQIASKISQSSLSLLFLSISATNVTNTSSNCNAVNPALQISNLPSNRFVASLTPPFSPPRSLATNRATYPPPLPPSSLRRTIAPSSIAHFIIFAPSPTVGSVSPVCERNFLRK